MLNKGLLKKRKLFASEEQILSFKSGRHDVQESKQMKKKQEQKKKQKRKKNKNNSNNNNKKKDKITISISL